MKTTSIGPTPNETTVLADLPVSNHLALRSGKRYRIVLWCVSLCVSHPVCTHVTRKSTMRQCHGLGDPNPRHWPSRDAGSSAADTCHGLSRPFVSSTVLVAPFPLPPRRCQILLLPTTSYLQQQRKHLLPRSIISKPGMVQRPCSPSEETARCGPASNRGMAVRLSAGARVLSRYEKGGGLWDHERRYGINIINECTSHRPCALLPSLPPPCDCDAQTTAKGAIIAEDTLDVTGATTLSDTLAVAEATSVSSTATGTVVLAADASGSGWYYIPV